MTLLTCTPYSINTHRLLVRGTRVANDADLIEPVGRIVSQKEGSVYLLGYRINYFFAAVGIAAFVGAVTLITVLIIRRRRRKKRAHKEGDG